MNKRLLNIVFLIAGVTGCGRTSHLVPDARTYPPNQFYDADGKLCRETQGNAMMSGNKFYAQSLVIEVGDEKTTVDLCTGEVRAGAGDKER